jgi:hypothetical protein
MHWLQRTQVVAATRVAHDHPANRIDPSRKSCLHDALLSAKAVGTSACGKRAAKSYVEKRKTKDCGA